AQAFLHGGHDFRLVLGMDNSLKGGKRTLEAAAGNAMDFLHVTRPLDRVRLDVPRPNADLAGFERYCDSLEVRKRSSVGLDLAGRAGPISIVLGRHRALHGVCFPSRLRTCA